MALALPLGSSPGTLDGLVYNAGNIVQAVEPVGSGRGEVCSVVWAVDEVLEDSEGVQGVSVERDFGDALDRFNDTGLVVLEFGSVIFKVMDLCEL